MNVCKIGFPVSSLEKYVEKLNKIGYAYVIYKLDKEKAELIEIARRKGKQLETTHHKCLQIYT